MTSHIDCRHETFPSCLSDLSQTPQKLYFFGDWNIIHQPMLSVVGARDVRPWVVEWMENELAPAIKEFSLSVVSGGARGVDQCSHRLALRSQNSTVVILPSGLKELYPRSLQSWIGREGVLFVTEYPDDLKMFKSHFYDRNRIIVALSPITLVVQASEKSGSMISARLAMDLGRRVLTLPASPMDRAFAGNNMLLFDGAEMVRNRQDLLGIFSQTYINSNSASKGKGLLAEE